MKVRHLSLELLVLCLFSMVNCAFEPVPLDVNVQSTPPFKAKTVYRELYDGDSVEEFLELCLPNKPEPIGKDAPPEVVEKNKRQEAAFIHCDGWSELERNALEDAKRRVSIMRKTILTNYDLVIQMLIYAYILCLGGILIYRGHFSFRIYFDQHHYNRSEGYSFFVYNFALWHGVETRTKITHDAQGDEETSSGEEFEAYEHGWKHKKTKKKKKYNKYPRYSLKERKMITFNHGLERV